MTSHAPHPNSQDAPRFSIVLCVLACLPLPAMALTPGARIGAGDVAFYTFALSAAAFSAAIVAAYRQPRWLGYVLLTVLLTINAAAQDGMLAHLLGETDFVLWALPFLIYTAVTAYGFWLVSARLEAPHRLVRFRGPSRILAGVSALLCLSSALWLKRIPLSAMWVPANFLFFTMIVAQTLPPLTWPTPDARLRRLIRAFPIVVGIAVLGTYLAHWLVFDFDRLTLNTVNRLLMVLVAGFALTIVVWQAFSAAREKDAAERRALEAAKAEAEMQLALERAEQDYAHARRVVAHHRDQLASVSHDLKQPIASLRIAIDQLKRDTAGPDADKLDRAVDYIDSLARAYLDELTDEVASTDEDGGHVDGARETINTLTFAAMIEQMFADDAAGRGIDFKVVAHAVDIDVDPLPTMRAMTNLVSNALAHAHATRIRVFFRRSAGAVHYMVMDNGCGMDAGTLEAVLSDGVRASDSEGHGLGLGIVQALCEAQGVGFSLVSRVGVGTRAVIEIAMAARSDESFDHRTT